MPSLANLESPSIAKDPPQGARIYRPELDALRFFAFFAVFLHHTLNDDAAGLAVNHPLLGRLLPVVRDSLGFGLCLFFFLSAFLITSLLEVEKARTGTVDLRKFYIRRILRIWPLYFLFLGAVFFLGLWWKPVAIAPWHLLALFLLAGNWYSIFFGLGSNAISPLWSISVEEQFYILWPSLSRALPAPLLYRFCCVLCGVSLAATWLLAAHGANTHSIWLDSLVQSLFFATGALLALHIGFRQQTRSVLRAGLALGAGLLLWPATARFAGFTASAHIAIPWRLTLGYASVAISCALMLWGFLHLPEKLLPRPLLYLGRISYGLYVFHGLVNVATAELDDRLPAVFHLPGALLVTQLLVTIGIATLSYELLEKPFLKLKSRFELVHTRVV